MTPAPFHHVAAVFGRLRRPAFDARAAVELLRFELPFFPPTRYTLAASALLTVLNDILINKRRLVVELGSGFSTAYIAKALGETGGSLISVESNAEWLDHVSAHARRCGVADRITPVHAPLKPHETGGDWYATDILAAALEGREIDLLLVDGPVASSRAKRRARAPAVPELSRYLAPRCAVFLDDLHRFSHVQIAREWGAILGVKFSIVHARGGFAYAARGAGFDPIL
ncbi:MAG: hypothetical protein GC153_00960 [Alphaproteobacteria bacterium]|nr:hypothetical protein [Alphaproteobacteria bacterium]